MSRTESASLYAIVLAAGAATRFGSPKQCAQLGGVTLIQRAVTAATGAVGPSIRVVLGAHAAEIAATLDLPADQVLINTHWAEGIASSIRLAVAHLPASCQGALILLADQPYVTGPSLQRLITLWRSAPDHIVASSYHAVIGAPCLFPRWCFGELSELAGDAGAQKLLARHFERVRTMLHPEAGIDIDTPAQLAEQRASTISVPEESVLPGIKRPL